MSEETPKNETIKNDALAENADGETPVVDPVVAPEEPDTFDENNIDPEVRDYKPPEKSDDDDEDFEDDGKKAIKEVQQLTRKFEVDTFFNTNPEYAKYKGAAQKYLNHPNYASLPVHNVVAIVASKDMQKIGAMKERAAAKAVATTKVPGITVRPTEGGKTDWQSATKEDFEAKKAQILGRLGN